MKADEAVPTRETVSRDDISNHCKIYPSLISGELEKLDRGRYDDLPALLAQREKDGTTWLTKSELQTLLEWKLRHGKFRPNLRKLVASNSEDDVKSVTTAAYAMDLSKADVASVQMALIELCKLKGVGPATASLLLSVFRPSSIPFFSDELFQFVGKIGPFHPSTPGAKAKIAYSNKEYQELFTKVQEMRQRLHADDEDEISATDLEKVAYVLAREPEDQPVSQEKEQDKVVEKTTTEATASPPAKRRRTQE